MYTPNPSVTDGDSSKMKIVYFSNEFPHDDLQGLCRQLHQHSKDRKHPLLARFLDDATFAVREEVRALPTNLRKTIPPFESVLNFAGFSDLRNGQLCGLIDGILLCAIEVGTLIG